VVSYGEDRTEKWLTSETADLRALAAQVLGAALDYDAEHSGDLVPSVRIWLEHDRQTDRAARPRCGWPCAPRPPCPKVSVGGYELRA
jgi:hypothetical protein